MDRKRKLYEKWKDRLNPIFEETKDIETKQEWLDWIREYPDKALIVMAAFLEVMYRESIFD